MSTVFATEGGRRFHATVSCPAIEGARLIWDSDQFGPPSHAMSPTTPIEALGAGKEPCSECFPGQRAALYRGNCEDNFGHEPVTGASIFGLAETVCARCTERGVWYGTVAELLPVHIPWPCASAVVLGLANRKEISA
ncbi:hypothetical protein [Streptomyces microflavus]|uniref:hypothetical protein n=1 Tax=Streptomyces microflavus TaxID=1919 RepID=UPI002E381F03|nr:hypothetical protein [Streptomyces microflavus]